MDQRIVAYIIAMSWWLESECAKAWLKQRAEWFAGVKHVA